MSRLIAALVLALCAAACADAGSTNDGFATQTGALGHCRSICPKCHPGEVCPKIACFLECTPDPSNVCGVKAMCAIGYRWSQPACKCLPTGGAQAECSTDADCHLHTNYCNGCACEVLSAQEPDTMCPVSQQANCFADPCLNQIAVCSAGQCVAGYTL